MKQRRCITLIAVLAALAVWAAPASGFIIEGAGAPPIPPQPSALTVTADEAVSSIAEISTPARAKTGKPVLQDSLAQLVAAKATGRVDKLATLAGLPHVDLAAGTARVILEMAVSPKAGIAARPAREMLVTPSGSVAERRGAPQVVIRDDLAAAIAATGASYETAYEDWVQVLAPIGSLGALARIAGVRAVRLPFFSEAQEVPIPSGSGQSGPAAGEQLSEGVALTDAGAWQLSSVNGTGISLAVFDLGFTGWDARRASGDLPSGAKLVLHDFSADYDFGPPGTSGYGHGTACAEIAYDMAPGATVHLYAWGTEVEFANAVSDYINNVSGKKVATSSIAWFNAGPYDGTGPINAIVDNAQAAGVFWANSAGNYQTSHWSGTAQGYQSGDLVAFGSGNVQGIGPQPPQVWQVGAGSTLTAFLEWNDWNAARTGNTSHVDYDLFLLQWSGSTWVQVASSIGNQCGASAPPTEAIVYTTPDDGYFGLAIERYTGGGACTNNFGHWLTLHSFSEVYVAGQGAANLFWYVNPCNSVIIPADGNSAVAIGATFWNADLTAPLYGLETFTSFGPRNAAGGGNPGAAVNKPDMVAPDGVSTATYGASDAVSYADGGSGFWGTSGAAPHVAGAAALAWQANPGFSLSQLRSYLQGRALYKAGGGACGGSAVASSPASATSNNRYGWGRLRLGQPFKSFILGRVRTADGSPIADVTISPGSGGSATTDGNGNYTLTDLPAGTYTLTPSKAGYDFSPPSIGVTVPPDAIAVDFTAAPGTSSISGVVALVNGTPVAGVTVSSGSGRSATTDGSGNYTLAHLPAGTYTLTPSKAGYGFLPPSKSVTVPPDTTDADFTARGLDFTIHLPLVSRNLISYFEGPWEVEDDNDDWRHANGPVRSGRDYYGYPDDLKDYWSAYLPANGTITVDLTNHTGQDVQLHLYYGEPVQGGYVKRDDDPPYHIEHSGSAGWYYVYINTGSGWNSTTPYTLRVTYP
jgi:hypothetical protein